DLIAASSFSFPCYCAHRQRHSFPTRRSSDLKKPYCSMSGPSAGLPECLMDGKGSRCCGKRSTRLIPAIFHPPTALSFRLCGCRRSEEHTSELQSRENLVCRLLLEKKKHTSAV